MGKYVDSNGFDGIGDILPRIACNFRFLQIDCSLYRKLLCLDLELHSYLGKNKFGDKESLFFCLLLKNMTCISSIARG
jgi:hypothetical protein